MKNFALTLSLSFALLAGSALGQVTLRPSCGKRKVGEMPEPRRRIGKCCLGRGELDRDGQEAVKWFAKSTTRAMQMGVLSRRHV